MYESKTAMIQQASAQYLANEAAILDMDDFFEASVEACAHEELYAKFQSKIAYAHKEIHEKEAKLARINKEIEILIRK